MSKFIIPRHWTFRYLFNRFKLFLFERKNPNFPWLTKTAIKFLNDFLKPSDTGVEFGSGRSTLWLASRVKHITSIEHYEGWYHKVKDSLLSSKIENVTLIFIDREKGFEEEQQNSKYAKALDNFADNSLDFVLVDGIFRSSCAYKAIDKVRPGGIIIVDNVERYIVMETFSPEAIKNHNEMSATWVAFQHKIKDWRMFHTSNGVTDTTFFFKPHQLKDSSYKSETA